MTITLTREEAQQVLNALDHQAKIFPVRKAIDVLRARLAQYSELDDAIAAGDGTLHGAIDYWQKKAQRKEWQGLTDEEIAVLWMDTEKTLLMKDFACAIEAKLKEKNT